MNLPTLITLIALAGIGGTSAMIAFMTLIHRSKLANADMIRAIGSAITGSKQDSFLYGLGIHYSMGIFFAFSYALLNSYAPIQTPGSIILLGGLTGMVHGVVIGLLIMVVVAEHHPLPQFREAGLDVGFSHAAGHVIYGITTGFILSKQWMTTGPILEDLRESLLISERLVSNIATWGSLTLVSMLLTGVFSAYLLNRTSEAQPMTTVNQGREHIAVPIPIRPQSNSNQKKAA
jgi:hypothetical protein